MKEAELLSLDLLSDLCFRREGNLGGSGGSGTRTGRRPTFFSSYIYTAASILHVAFRCSEPGHIGDVQSVALDCCLMHAFVGRVVGGIRRKNRSCYFSTHTHAAASNLNAAFYC